MDNESAYLLYSFGEIYSHLKLLFESKCIFHAHFGRGRESFITTLLEIDKTGRTLVLDYGPKDYLNQELLSSEKVVFRSEYEGIKTGFTSESVKKIPYQKGSAFRMPFPGALLWLQRREFYRVKVPVAKDCYCQIRLPGQAEPLRLALYDISVSGFSMLIQSSPLAAQLAAAGRFEACPLALGDIGAEPVSFEILYTCVINPPKLNKIEKMGCKFVHMPKGFDSAIQRFMQYVERESLKKG